MRESPLASSSGADIAKPLHSRTTPGRWLPSHTHPAAARYGLLAHRWSPEAVCYWCCPCRVRRRPGLSSLLLSKTRRPAKARGADKHAGIAVDIPSTERMRDSQHLSGRDLNTLVSTDQRRIARQHEHDGESGVNPVSGTWHGGDMMQREERIRVDRQNAPGLGMANRQVVALLLSKTRRPPKAGGTDKCAGIAVDLPGTERIRDCQHLSGRDVNPLVSTDQRRIARQHEHDGESRANSLSGTGHGGDVMQREERIRVDRQNALGLGMANRQVVAHHQAVKPRVWQGHGGDGMHGNIEANAQMRLFAR